MIPLARPHAFLVNFDGCLLNNDLVQNYQINQLLALTEGQVRDEEFHTVYRWVRENAGGVSNENIVAEWLAKLGRIDREIAWNVFLNTPCKEFIIPGADTFLKHLKKVGIPYIFTQSYEDNSLYQTKKIESSGLGSIVGMDHVSIKKDKTAALPGFLSQLRDSGIFQVTIMDDKASMLDQMIKACDGYAGVTDIKLDWIFKPFGEYAQDKSTNPKIRTIKTFDEITNYLGIIDPEITPSHRER